MKSRQLMCVSAMIVFAALAVPIQLAAQDSRDDIGTFGGTVSGPGKRSGSPRRLHLRTRNSEIVGVVGPILNVRLCAHSRTERKSP